MELHEDGSYGNDMRVDDEHQVNSSGAPAALQEKRRRSPVARGGGVGGGDGAKAVDNGFFPLPIRSKKDSPVRKRPPFMSFSPICPKPVLVK